MFYHPTTRGSARVNVFKTLGDSFKTGLYRLVPRRRGSHGDGEHLLAPPSEPQLVHSEFKLVLHGQQCDTDLVNVVNKSVGHTIAKVELWGMDLSRAKRILTAQPNILDSVRELGIHHCEFTKSQFISLLHGFPKVKSKTGHPSFSLHIDTTTLKADDDDSRKTALPQHVPPFLDSSGLKVLVLDQESGDANGFLRLFAEQHPPNIEVLEIHTRSLTPYLGLIYQWQHLKNVSVNAQALNLHYSPKKSDTPPAHPDNFLQRWLAKRPTTKMDEIEIEFTTHEVLLGYDQALLLPAWFAHTHRRDAKAQGPNTFYDFDFEVTIGPAWWSTPPTAGGYAPYIALFETSILDFAEGENLDGQKADSLNVLIHFAFPDHPDALKAFQNLQRTVEAKHSKIVLKSIYLKESE